MNGGWLEPDKYDEFFDATERSTHYEMSGSVKSSVAREPTPFSVRAPELEEPRKSLLQRIREHIQET